MRHLDATSYEKRASAIRVRDYSALFKGSTALEWDGMIFNFLANNCEISLNSSCVDFITSLHNGG